MPPSSNAPRPRTWTGNEQGSSGKWILVFWLGTALIIALGLYIYWIVPRNSAQVYFVSLAVEDYGDVLPRAHYAIWPIDQIHEHQRKHDLVIWQEAKGVDSAVQGTGSLEMQLSKLGPALQKQDIQPKDTLVIQLRMHAQAKTNQDDILELNLLTGEKGATSLSSVGRYPVKELLHSLNDIPARNIVILADVCDLDYAPEYDLAVNPVTRAFQSLCATEKPKSGQDVWILCAARDYERNHVSHLRRRTLLQSACEFALARKSNGSADSRDTKISLAEFYSQVWRYYRHATQEQGSQATSDSLSEVHQLPVLLRIGEKEYCQPSMPDSNSWSLAENVTVVRLAPPKSDNPKEEGEEDKGETTAKNDAPKPAADADSVKEKLDPVLDYWKTRDDLLASLWPPTLYAPQLWQSHQERLAEKQFVFDWEKGVGPRLKELQLLREVTTETGAAASLSSNQYFLLQAYYSFMANERLAAARAPWENDQLLTVEDRKVWPALRDKYRVYAQRCADLPAWARWSRHQPLDIQNFSNLVGALVQLRGDLPAGNKAALDATAFDTSALNQSTIHLSASFQRIVEPLSDKLRGLKPLTWRDELHLQELLESPLLDFASRKTLWQAWLKLQKDEANLENLVVEPDKNFAQLNRDIPIQVSPAEFPSSVTTWIDATKRLAELVYTAPSKSIVSSPSAGLNWCVEFGKSVNASKPSSLSPQDVDLHRWHQKCLAGLFKPPSPEDVNSYAGIVLPASLSRALRVSVANQLPGVPSSPLPAIGFQGQPQMPLTLSVQRADGSEVKAVWFAWKPVSPARWETDYLTVATDKEEQAPDKPVQLAVNNRTLNLNLKTNVDSRQLASPMEIEVKLREDSSSEVVLTRIQIFPRQPDLVELRAYRQIAQEPEPLTGGYTVLKIMAIQGAKSRFDFKVNNLSSQRKRCVASLYALRESEVTEEGQSPRLAVIKLDRTPLAKSLPIDLPASQLGQNQPQTLKLQPEPAPTEDNPPGPIPNNSSNFRWLYFEIQELGPEDKPTGKQHGSFCRLEAKRPEADVLLITPLKGEDLRLSLEPNPDAWSLYGHNDLAVEVKGVAGKTLRADPEKILFTPKSKADIMLIKAADSQPEYHAQLSIGGYPRVTAYLAPHNGEGARIDGVSTATIDPQSIRAIADPTKRKDFYRDVKLEQFRDNQYIFPMRDDLGSTIDYSILKFSAQVDVQSSDDHPSFQLIDAWESRLIGTVPFASDRQVEFGFEFKDALAVTAKAHDLSAEIRTEKLSGKLKLQTFVQGRNQSEQPLGEPIVLIFDSEPPEKANIAAVQNGKPVSKRTITATIGDKLVFRIAAHDSLSGIQGVRMAIDSDASISRNEFDEKDEINAFEKGRLLESGEWEFVLSSEVTSQLESGSISVVASSMDKAGNLQNSHPPVKILLQAPQKPPKSNDQAK